jgi:hypothetical protein
MAVPTLVTMNTSASPLKCFQVCVSTRQPGIAMHRHGPGRVTGPGSESVTFNYYVAVIVTDLAARGSYLNMASAMGV